jgi:hypothetical protein
MHKNILNSNKLESCTKCITSNAIQWLFNLNVT